MSRQDEEDKQQPVTVVQRTSMLAPRESAKYVVKGLSWEGRWLTPSPQISRCQKYTFTANWISRGSRGLSRVDPISPKWLSVKLFAPETAFTPLPPKPG